MVALRIKPFRRGMWKKGVILVTALLLLLNALGPLQKAAAYSQSARLNPITNFGAPATQAADPSPNPNPDPNQTLDCPPGVGPLGWAICPLTELLINGTNLIEDALIIPYLTVSPLSTDPANPVYKLWESVRNIANIAFIIAFFFIIFSQATSYGLSNYGIKKMLPQLVETAVLANISYYAVAAAIDAFNLFGAGVSQLVLSVITTGGGGSTSQQTSPWAIGITSAAVFGVGAWMGWIWPLILSIFVIILVAVVVLVLRQMLIILLVIISPLLAVSKLFPNLEQQGNKGWNLLFKLLAMYPLIILLFATGKIIGTLLSSGDLQLATGDNISKQVSDGIKVVFAAFAAAAPLVLIPATFATAGNLLGNAYNRLRGYGNQRSSALQKSISESGFAKHQQVQRERRNREVAAGNYSLRSRNPFNYINPAHYARGGRSWVNSGLNRNAAYNLATGGYGAEQALQDRQQRKKTREDTAGFFNGDYNLAEAWLRTKGGTDLGATYTHTVKEGGETINGRAYRAGARVRRKYVDDLNPGQKQVLQHITASPGNVPDKYMAAMELLANSGRGNAADMVATEKAIQAYNPASAAVDIYGLRNTLGPAYRNNGRGDIAVNLTNAAPGTSPIDASKPNGVWENIAPKNITRHVFEESGDNDLVRTTHSTQTGGRLVSKSEASLRDFLKTNERLNVEKIVGGLDGMEQRARNNVEKMLYDMYANQSSIKGTILDNGTDRYSTNRGQLLEDLRREFKLKPR
jgi:hypothetical protein